jgi:hypothetical protein
MLWLDQIGDFFLNLSVTATRLDGSTFTVHPIYASPEGEGNAPDYGDGQPKIVFFDYDIKEDTQLLEGDPTMVVRKDLDGDGIVDTAEVQGKPHPYILYFQVELITYWREDDLALRTIWQQLFPDRGGIDVYDSHEPPPGASASRSSR